MNNRLSLKEIIDFQYEANLYEFKMIIKALWRSGSNNRVYICHILPNVPNEIQQKWKKCYSNYDLTYQEFNLFSTQYKSTRKVVNKDHSNTH